MRPSGVILGLILAVHITARPIDGDYMRPGEIFRPRKEPTVTDTELLPFPTGFPLGPFGSFPGQPEKPTSTYSPVTQSTASPPDPSPSPPEPSPSPPEPSPSPTTPTPTPTPQQATQSCTTKDHNWFLSYSILIRVPYAGPNDCDATYHALEHTVPISSWQCVNEDGNIRLWFNAYYDQGDAISRILQSRYPTVNSFNCPSS